MPEAVCLVCSQLCSGLGVDVLCDMDTDGGGWMKITLANNFGLDTADWWGILMVEKDHESDPWRKCADDAAAYYPGITQHYVKPALQAGSGSINKRFPLAYARPDTGKVYTRQQMRQLRLVAQELSPTTRIVATSADDDYLDYTKTPETAGHEVYAFNEFGGSVLLTVGSDGDCGGNTGCTEANKAKCDDLEGKTGFRLWSTNASLSVLDMEVPLKGGTVEVGALPAAFTLPFEVGFIVGAGAYECTGRA